MTSKAFAANPADTSMFGTVTNSSPKDNHTRKGMRQTGSSTLEELNRPGIPFFGSNSATPTVG